VKICITVYTEYLRVTDRRAERQTDRHRDRRTDILPQHSPRYAYASRGKNYDFRPIFRFISEWCKIETVYYGRRIGNRTQAFEWYQFE